MSDESTAVNITINDTRRAAERYLRAGLAVIPVPAGEKNPNRRGWQQERWTIADIPRCWSNGQNIGLLTGEPSGWLVDVDLDCPEAVKIAGRFLDPTRTSGRESTPDAHWWYRAEGIRSMTFEDVERIMHAAWDAAGFESEKAKRDAHADIEAIVEDTAEGLEEGIEVSGGPTLDELRSGLPRKIARYWRWNGRNTDQPPTTGADTGEGPARFNLTDLGNAERFVADHGSKVRYCGPWGKWLVYDGKRWAQDDTGQVERLMKDTVRAIYAEAS